MKLQLESYEKIFRLKVTQTVSRMDAQVLMAGISKLVILGRPWVFIDLSGAVFALNAVAVLQEYSRRDVPLSAGRIHWIGSLKGFNQSETIEDALELYSNRDLQEYEAKISLENRISSIERLILARDWVVSQVEGDEQKIGEIESTYILLNRNLRAAHTHLINRFLDPVFSDLWQEPVASREMITRFETLLGFSPMATEVRAEVEKSEDASLPYRSESLSKVLPQLRSVLKTLQSKTKDKLMDGRADRAISLYLENLAVRMRIRELREVWIVSLFGDSLLTESDYSDGFSPFLERTEDELKKNELKKGLVKKTA